LGQRAALAHGLMSVLQRERYLNNVFNRMHDKLNNAYEDIYDGDFEDCKEVINSLIYDLRQLKKTMEP